MGHPLEQRIGRVRRQVRLLLVVYAVGWTMATITAAVLVLGFADYWLRFQDPGIRLMGSLAVVAVACWAVNRFALHLLSFALGDVQIAQRIERYFPVLTDRLASTVQFLKQSELDPQAGSAALRTAVILETASAAEDLDFSQVCERRPARKALAAATVAVLVADCHGAPGAALWRRCVAPCQQSGVQARTDAPGSGPNV